jgi:hypothetical protein
MIALGIILCCILLTFLVIGIGIWMDSRDHYYVNGVSIEIPIGCCVIVFQLLAVSTAIAAIYKQWPQ